ncbi:MnhB domain-containing protein [Halobacteriaceae archaeon GCM10025711]
MTRRPGDGVVVAKTVRLLAPVVLTFGLFTALHGTSSVGGGFQGGAVVGATLVLVAFAFGVAATRRWLRHASLVRLAAAGVGLFAAVAVGSLVAGGAFLEPGAYPGPKAAVYAIELVELGIAATVAAVVALLFFHLAGGDGRA